MNRFSWYSGINKYSALLLPVMPSHLTCSWIWAVQTPNWPAVSIRSWGCPTSWPACWRLRHPDYQHFYSTPPLNIRKPDQPENLPIASHRKKKKPTITANYKTIKLFQGLLVTVRTSEEVDTPRSDPNEREMAVNYLHLNELMMSFTHQHFHIFVPLHNLLLILVPHFWVFSGHPHYMLPLFPHWYNL